MNRKNKHVKEIHIPKAENILKETEPKIIIEWLDKIQKARDNGLTYCYLCADVGGVSKNAVERFLKAGYDIHYSYYEFDGSWFVKASWHDGCNGRLYDEQKREYVDVNKMFEF